MGLPVAPPGMIFCVTVRNEGVELAQKIEQEEAGRAR